MGWICAKEAQGLYDSLFFGVTTLLSVARAVADVHITRFGSGFRIAMAEVDAVFLCAVGLVKFTNTYRFTAP